MVIDIILGIAIIGLYVLHFQSKNKRNDLRDELQKKTYLFWTEENGFKVLKNSNGDTITKL